MGPILHLLVCLIFCVSVYGVPFQSKDTTNVTCNNGCAETYLEKINVHIIPHSHDDVGWLKTVDQYYFNDVNNVITSVMTALRQNPKRKFIQVETAFFKKWWEQQSDAAKDEVREFVNQGRLEIVNGAWAMNDEAAVHYQSTIDQFTLGHRYIEDNLGKCGRPKAGWQIDPFGHSREQASIFSQMGFDSVYFARLDYRDRNKRKTDKTMDLLWTGSANLGSESNIFTSVFKDHYSAPSGFCFDHVCDDSPIVEDEESPEYNLEERVNKFVEDVVEDQIKYYPTNNILITMGDDFRYQAALTTYVNIDRLMKGLKTFNKTVSDGREINVIYSTPSCYAKAVFESITDGKLKLSVKTDDFFPYADSANRVWSGYFTSRPTSKRYERQANNLLQISKQLSAISGAAHGTNNLLEEAIGVMQHHDAITGTEKAAVEQDYHRFLTKGIMESIAADSAALKSILGMTKDPELKTCLLQNVSICQESNKDEFNVLLYNPLAHTVSHYIQIPVSSESWTVTDPSGITVDNQIVESVDNFEYICNAENSTCHSHILVFEVTLPAVGYSVYNVKKAAKIIEETVTPRIVDNEVTIGFENSNVTLTNGLLKSIAINGKELPLTQEMMYYISANESGAYIFRPDTDIRDAQPFDGEVKTTTVNGKVMKEIKQEFNSWISQTIRIYEDEDFIEFDWVVGPIDTDSDEIGKEIISRFSTNLKTQNIFYTDSNGRELIQRKKDYRPDYEYTNEEPQAGNYYPINNRIVIREDTTEFAIITDRSQGGSSLKEGQVEVMLHRACHHDDGKGVGEVLNEQQYDKGLVARGSLYITLGDVNPKSGTKSLATVERNIALRKHLAPWIFFPQTEISTKTESFLKHELPENIHLLTLDKWNDDTILIRLEHILEKNDDENLSQEVTVDISTLFVKFEITSAIETTLSGVTPLSELSRMKWAQIEQTESEDSPLLLKNRQKRSETDLKITLAPMQIRTFIAKTAPYTVKKSNSVSVLLSTQMGALYCICVLYLFNKLV